MMPTIFRQANRGAWRLAAALLMALVNAGAQADEAKTDAQELKVSVAVGPAYALGQAAERWAQRVSDKSEGQLVARLHPGAVLSLRDPALEFVALRDGAADLAIGSSLFWSAQVPQLAVVSLPWLAPEPAQLDALVAGPVAETLLAAVARNGVVPLALASLGHRELALRAKAVKVPGDLAGLKIRIPPSPVLAAMYGALGAQPLTMPFAQAQAALAAGTVDAQDGSSATFAATRLDSLGLKWVVQWGAVAEVAVFAVNQARWNALTEAQRAVVRDSAKEIARELALLVRKEDEAALEALRKGGMTVVRLTPAGRAPFAAAVRGAYDKLAADAGSELARAAEAAVKATAQ